MKTLFSISFFFIFIFSINQNAKGQVGSKSTIIGISPSKIQQVNGLMIHFFPNDFAQKPQSQIINGIELNLNPIGLFAPYVFAIHCLDAEIHQPTLDNLDSLDCTKFKKINGLNIGLINLEPTVINGLDINGTGSFESIVNGITCSLVLNKHHKMNGVTIAAIGNHDTECKGVQIGLFNSAKKLRGIQIGIWNKNEKRSLPFINWQFRK